MLGVNVCVYVVAIMFCLCKGLKVGKDLFLRRWGIIMFCIGFCSGIRFLIWSFGGFFGWRHLV